MFSKVILTLLIILWIRKFPSFTISDSSKLINLPSFAWNWIVWCIPKVQSLCCVLYDRYIQQHLFYLLTLNFYIPKWKQTLSRPEQEGALVGDLPYYAPLEHRELRINVKMLSFGGTIKGEQWQRSSALKKVQLRYFLWIYLDEFISDFFIQLKVFVGIW